EDRTRQTDRPLPPARHPARISPPPGRNSRRRKGRKCCPQRGFPPGGRRAGFSRNEGKQPGTLVKSQVVQYAPRARGDGPPVGWPRTRGEECSPRTRGWSLVGVAVGDGGEMLPPHAGTVRSMILTETARVLRFGAPRCQ